jgi:hypothetical protein
MACAFKNLQGQSAGHQAVKILSQKALWPATAARKQPKAKAGFLATL